MDILCLIGSKNRAVTELCLCQWQFLGAPLASWSLKQARKASFCSDTFLLSGSESAQQLASSNAAACFASLRPEEGLAASCLRAVEQMYVRHGRTYEWLLILDPTWPLRLISDLEYAYTQLVREGLEALCSVTRLPSPPFGSPSRGGAGQSLVDGLDEKNFYYENSAFIFLRPSLLKKEAAHFHPSKHYELASWQNLVYDDPGKKTLCELALRQYGPPAERPLANAGVALLVFDFDGVLTDNKVLVFEDGKEAVLCDRGDGWGFGLLKKMALPMLVLSSEVNPVVQKRCDKLGLDCIHGVKQKLPFLQEYCQAKGYPLTKTLYIGNDLNDLECLQAVGFPFAPSDAVEALREVPHITFLRSKGGQQLVRELLSYF